MRTAVTVLFTVALGVQGLAQAPAGADADAIRRIVQQHDDARNRADWKALGELFTEDAEQLTSAGEWRRGRAEIEKGVAQMTATTYKGSKYTTTVERVRMVAPNVAVVDGAFEIANIGGRGRRGHMTYVMVKSGDRWRIAAGRSMVPTPAGATPPR